MRRPDFMRLSAELEAELADLLTRAADDKPADLKLDRQLNGSRVLCDFDAINDLASTFLALSIVNNSLKDAPPERIQQVAQSLTERINYLPEPLRLIECDPTAETYQVRSEKPTRTPSGLNYFEVLVKRRVVTLTRFRQPTSGRRQAIPTTVTHEIFERLINDMSDAFK